MKEGKYIMAKQKVATKAPKKKKQMGEQTGKIVKTIVITSIILAVIAGVIYYAIVNSNENLILGEWQATAKDGTVVTYKFTDEFENQSTKETIYYLTVKNPDGSVEEDKGTYNISNDTIITFRSITDPKTSNPNAEFEIKKDVMKFKYSAGLDYDESGIEFKKIADYEKPAEE